MPSTDPNNPPRAAAGGDATATAPSGNVRRITYLGHASTLIELDGTRFLTDPVLGRGVAHLRRTTPPPATPDEITAVLISHGHRDHLDRRSLRSLPRHVPIIVPRGLGSLVASWKFADVTEVDETAEERIGDITVRATHAEHGGRSAPGRPAVAVGYVLEGSAKVFFAGDTDLFPGMAELAGGLDAALLPIWGWGPSIGPGHLDPVRAAEALTLLEPRHAIPIHWGTLRSFHRSDRARFLREPAAAFVAAARERAPEVAVHVLDPGGSLDL
jgi:L-ascorbate metabolism protein UlaG (beta-lactamase superfamily)